MTRLQSLAGTFLAGMLVLSLTPLASGQSRVPSGRFPGSAPVQATPLNPYASSDPRLNTARPVLELLLTLRQLTGMARALNLTPAQVASLHSVLSDITTGPALNVSAADPLNSQLLALLGDAQRQQLQVSRDAQTARLRALLTRARVASEDGHPQTARFAYSQWLGAATVDALLKDTGDAAVTRLLREAARLADQALGQPLP
jgi:hypothetical protein